MSTNETIQNWYIEVSGEGILEQGDLIHECQIVQPKAVAQVKGQKLSADIVEYNVIILSQSCDLAARKIDLVLVCPFYTLTELSSYYPEYKSPKMREKLRRGQVVGYHLLNKCKVNDTSEDYLIVDFKSVYAVPFDFLQNITKVRGSRLRLQSPYKEHLSQAFARFFMRVGLPVDIPSFV